MYFYLHCPDEETEASERFGNVPNDIGPGKDGKAFAVYPIARPHPRHFLILGFIPLITFWDYPVSCLLSPLEQGPYLTHGCIGPGT